MAEELEQGAGAEETQGSAPPAADTQGAPPNWDDDPKFREYKSNQDRRMNVLARQAQDAQDQAARLAAQQEQAYVAQLNELDQEKHYRQQAEAQNRQMQQQMADERAALQKLSVLSEVAQMEGVPREVLMSASDTMGAVRMARQYRQENPGQAPVGQPSAFNRPSPPPVDMGGGRAPAAVNDLQLSYDKAMKEYDTSAALDIMAEADKAGVTLEE